jgi:CRISPR system Cascade subunit CasC
MIIELHLLQNFVPSNLNRDDTGSPKDCLFGGYTRARISSQCFKRAVRTEFRAARLFGAEPLAERTLRAQAAIFERLKGKHSSEESQRAARAALQAMGIKMNDKAPEQTSYLLFLSPVELDRLAQVVDDNWEAFLAASANDANEEPAASNGKGKKKKNESPLPASLANKLKEQLDGGRAADLALFGRMIADLPERDVEAACQVAHAISTHRVNTEFDFFTAVDDRTPQDTSGAGMLGVVEFNSACFYRYANIDVGQLRENLHGDVQLAMRSIEAFVRAMAYAVPTGKQNSMAAHNPPSLIWAVAREREQWNLANAFLAPVVAKGDEDMMSRSIKALDVYWGKLATMYGTGGMRGQWVATLEPESLDMLRPAHVPTFAALIQKVMDAVSAELSSVGA